MLKGKNLLILLGIAAVGYYFWNKNQNKKVVSTKSIVDEQNADGGFLSQSQLARLRRIASNDPQRAQRVASRMTSRLR